MEPAVGDAVDQSQLIHGQLYYLKFNDSETYHLVFFDKHKSYESSLPFVFVGEHTDFNNDHYDIYKVNPEDYMTNVIKNVKTRNVTHFPKNMGSEIQNPSIGSTYYFFEQGASKPVKGKLVDIKEVYVHRRSNETTEVYVVDISKNIQHFRPDQTIVYDVIARNNVLKNAKTIRKMIRNKGVNRTLRNITNVATNENTVFNRRKAMLNFRKRAWNDAAKN